MPLPIALGGITSSSQVLDAPTLLQPYEEDQNDRSDEAKAKAPLKPKELCQSIAFAVCPYKEWQARVVVSFYDLVREKKKESDGDDDDSSEEDTEPEQERDSTMVEVRIQISHLCRPLSPRYRETTYHLKLIDGAKDDYPSLQPQVVFSQDRKFLSVLLFHPHQHSSTVVVFQLRRPRTDWTPSSTSSAPQRQQSQSLSNIPIPSYVTNPVSNYNASDPSNRAITAHNSQVQQSSVQHPAAPVVATNPKFVSVWGITAICSIPISIRSDTAVGTGASDSSNLAALRPLLLAVCHDATLVWLDLRSAQAIATGTLPSSDLKLPITAMQASPTSCLEHGTVALVCNSDNNSAASTKTTTKSPECILASWSLESTTPKQQAFLKRASTGNVTVASNRQSTGKSVERNGSGSSGDGVTEETTPQGLTPSPSKRRDGVTPHRTLSGTFQSMLKSTSGTSSRRLLRGRRDSSKESSSKESSSSDRKDAPRRRLSRNHSSSSNSSSGRGGGMRRFESFRTKSMEKNANDLAEKLNQMNLPSLGNFVTNTTGTTNSTNEEEERAALQRRKLFLLQELQKRNPTGSWMTQEQHQQYEHLLSLETHEGEIDLKESSKTRKAPEGTSSGASIASVLNSTGIATKLQKPEKDEPGDDKEVDPSQHVRRRYPRRRSDPDKNGADKTRRQMKVGILSTWSGTTGNSQGEHQHLNSKKEAVDVCFGALSTILCVVYKYTATGPERRQRVAQVLTISETGDVAPVASLLLSLEQVEQAPSIMQQIKSESGSDVDESIHLMPANASVGHSTQSRFGIEFDASTNTFMVNAVFGNGAYWLGCVWDWRVDAIGWMIQHSSMQNLLWSRLSLGQDFSRGPHLVQIGSFDQERNSNGALGNIHISKRVIPSGFLSPSSSVVPALFEPSSLLLSSSHVAYPRATKKHSNVNLLELEWKTATLPAGYISSYGSPRIAAIGPTNSKSIAVASRHGLCVLDVKHRTTRWKQFAFLDEKAFTVVAMTWWEGRRMKKKKEDEADDLLIAIIRTANGNQYLSCWSSKHLDLAHQLMDTPRQEWIDGESQEEGCSWGIPLPNDVRATNLSLLVEPYSKVNGESGPRKAVLIVYSPDQQTAEFDYSVFQLQVSRLKASKAKVRDQSAKKQEHFVMAHKTLQGRLKNGARSVGPVSSVFIAGACFRFDLRKLRKRPSKKSGDVEDFVVTLGVCRTPGGMESLCLGNDGTAWIASVVKSEISKSWLTDLVHSDTLLGTEGPPTATFSWALQLSNGELLCWSVPSVMECRSGQLDEWQISTAFKEAKIDRPKGLRLPTLVCKREARDDRKRWLLGTLCDLGKATEWIQQASYGSQTAVSLGHVPDSKFGCILCSGQSLHGLPRKSESYIETGDFTQSFGDPKAYHQSPFQMTPPAVVTSIYTLLLESASLRLELPTMESSILASVDSLFEIHSARLEMIERHIKHRLTTAPNKDAVMMALRLLIFRSVEMLTRLHKKHSVEQSDVSESNLLLCVELYSATVDAVRCCTTNLQFASLFLEVGRQIEPSCLSHLFPLPSPSDSEKSDSEKSEAKEALDKYTAKSVVDLFNLCFEKRALAASASALPLLTSKAQARHYCGLLLDECIDSFLRNTHSRNMRYDCTEEERRVIGDIFRFGLKLEDADLFERNGRSNGARRRGVDGADDASLGSFAHTNDSRTTDDDSIDLHESQKAGNLICGLNGSGSVLNYIVPSTLMGESEKQKEEDAIRREASSFIKGSLDDPVLGFTSLPDWGNSSPSVAKNGDSDINSVAGLIGDALLDLLQSSRTDNNWKAMGALSKMLLQEGVEIPTSLDIFGRIAGDADPLDIASILPERYDDHKECEGNLIAYLSDEVKNCSLQVKESDAHSIVGLALLIFDRLEVLPLPDPGDQAVMELGVVVIILVAGKRCGRGQEVLNSISDEEDGVFRFCYEEILSHNEA